MGSTKYKVTIKISLTAREDTLGVTGPLQGHSCCGAGTRGLLQENYGGARGVGGCYGTSLAAGLRESYVSYKAHGHF